MAEKVLVYELYPISWGEGALKKMRNFLPRIKKLGATHVWLAPIYDSPRFDGGYDVCDYRSIDTRFGTVGDFADFVDAAHQLGLDVLMDLILNHTSTAHPWFSEHPEYYYWSAEDKPGWHNLFDSGPAWEMKDDLYYLHLFHKEQADLKWFEDGSINTELVKEFQDIIKFWTRLGVDGFRLDVPQSMNKSIEAETLEFPDLLDGPQAKAVLNAVFSGRNELFLMMECFDPTYGKIVSAFTEATPVDYVLNVCLKDSISSEEQFWHNFAKETRVPSYMLDLESHDSARFPSRCDIPAAGIIRTMFESDVQAICLYQGEELGLKNPTEQDFSTADMLLMDAQMSMQVNAGKRPEELRPLSRANAREPVDRMLKIYEKQEKLKPSILNYTIDQVKKWKKREED